MHICILYLLYNYIYCSRIRGYNKYSYIISKKELCNCDMLSKMCTTKEYIRTNTSK